MKAKTKKAVALPAKKAAKKDSTVVLIGTAIHPFAVIVQSDDGKWRFGASTFNNRSELTDQLKKEGCRWRETTMQEINAARAEVGQRVARVETEASDAQ